MTTESCETRSSTGCFCWAEFPELAKTYEPETTVERGPDDTAEPGQE
jgi:hypothetical protein